MAGPTGRNCTKDQCGGGGKPPFRPQLEGLETRLVPATFTVTLLTQAGVGSLSWAIGQANQAAGSSTINFAGGLARGDNTAATIMLNAALPALNKNITITGPTMESGRPSLAVARVDMMGGTPNFSVFSVNAGVSCVIENLGIQGGKADFGAGVNNQGTLTLSNCILSGNTALDSGGGVYNNGTLYVLGCELTNCIAEKYGGGIDNYGSMDVLNHTDINYCYADYGGGIANLGASTAAYIDEATVIEQNRAWKQGAGIFDRDARLTMIGGSLSYNECSDFGSGFGGGIYVTGSAVVTLTSVDIRGNSAATQGGGFVVAVGGSLTMSSCTIADNKAPVGKGGWWVTGSTLDYSTCSIDLTKQDVKKD